ncbi:MAG: hypothetical protein JWM11_5159 [Planctomycetaceae bacterium]|nr:hypothetical protein [Planctomycetaceae bacterium]
MKNKKVRMAVYLIVTFVIGFAIAQAVEKLVLHGAEPEWQPLFNGKDLTGWKASENGDFKVEDGTIVVRGKRAHLFTEKEYKNFDVKCEIMTKPGSNSGFFVHTKYMEDWPKQGYEVQVNCTQGDPVKNGSIYNVVKNYDPIAKDNEWYTLEVIVKGKNIVTKVNGKVVVDFTEPEGVTGDRKLGKGSFAIQAHDAKSEVRYRNIMIKELP